MHAGGQAVVGLVESPGAGLQKNSEKVIAYCKKRKSDTLPTAIQKSAN